MIVSLPFLINDRRWPEMTGRPGCYTNVAREFTWDDRCHQWNLGNLYARLSTVMTMWEKTQLFELKDIILWGSTPDFGTNRIIEVSDESAHMRKFTWDFDDASGTSETLETTEHSLLAYTREWYKWRRKIRPPAPLDIYVSYRFLCICNNYQSLVFWPIWFSQKAGAIVSVELLQSRS